MWGTSRTVGGRWSETADSDDGVKCSSGRKDGLTGCRQRANGGMDLRILEARDARAALCDSDSGGVRMSYRFARGER